MPAKLLLFKREKKANERSKLADFGPCGFKSHPGRRLKSQAPMNVVNKHPREVANYERYTQL